jgi:hypothetical protein
VAVEGLKNSAQDSTATAIRKTADNGSGMANQAKSNNLKGQVPQMSTKSGKKEVKAKTTKKGKKVPSALSLRKEAVARSGAQHSLRRACQVGAVHTAAPVEVTRLNQVDPRALWLVRKGTADELALARDRAGGCGGAPGQRLGRCGSNVPCALRLERSRTDNRYTVSA